ncbi:peptidoglycan DD-metalloendopeptidase family protein [Paenibacillus sp. FA6]|uniref:peptidoglycan DD-metalloendopeptidase family protein n=1 Tax=Paenibacillus sp. FA6 TaxID=3413029 RepID=UPI003F6550C6
MNTNEVRERDPEVVWKKERGRWNEDYGKRTNHSFISSFIWRLLLSAILFGLIIGVYRSQQAWAVSIQHYIAQSLNREMDFQAAESWYVAHFGEAPTIIPIFKESQDDPLKVIASLTLIAPMHGIVTTPFSADLRGIEISPNKYSNATQQVKSVATGRVIEVLNETLSGKRLTIQHMGGLVAVYGHLDTTLKVNDWVEAEDSLGWLSNGLSGQPQALYFAMKQGEGYIDPLEVMSFD